MGEFKCPVEGCEHEPLQTLAGLKSHLRTKHPDFKLEELEEVREVPIVQEDFAAVLQKYKIKADLAANIAEHISYTGGPNVFEEPELLLKGLIDWSAEIAPSKRKNIMTRWFAEKQIDIPSEIQQKAGMKKEQLDKAEEETKEGAGAKFFYEPESRQIRPAKKDEVGVTLAQAKELKKMADEDEKAGAESPFMQDGEGHWVLNPKARVTGVELMATQFMQQAQAKGEAADPITAMARAAENMKILREGFGGGPSNQPAWMTDPVAFVEAIKKITGGDGGDSALRETLTNMQKSMDEMKEERYRDQFTAQQKQIQDLSTVLKQTIETISDIQKGKVGRTEMDIIHEIVTGGKEELSGMRKDIKEAFSSTGFPAAKSAEEREARKKRTKKALKTDEDIEELGKQLFFSQG